MNAPEPRIQSLVWATDLDIIRELTVVERRDHHWVVSCPSQPDYWWGNFLLFDQPPQPGDGERWQAIFAAEFAAQPDVRHQTFAWDRTDGASGAAESEFLPLGYTLERSAGLIARPEQLRPHQRHNREVQVRALRPFPGEDEELWDQVIDLQAADPFEHVPADEHRAFLHRRQQGLRAGFRSGAGAWFVALDQGQVVGSLGVVVTDTRARYQHVDTLASHRRRGIASRLVVEAARLTQERHAVDHFVIVADPDYHAISIYESVGFRPIEHVCGVQRPPAPR